MTARPNAPLCLVLLSYVGRMEEVDRVRPAHVRWIEQAMDEGVMLLAGRRADSAGGVLLFRGREDAVAVVAATDPFVTEGVATFEVVAFNASLAMDGIAQAL